MKHHRLVSKMPQQAQQDVQQEAQNNFEAKILFLQSLTEQLIRFSFGKAL